MAGSPGDLQVRGVSGGQKKRVTTGQALTSSAFASCALGCCSQLLVAQMIRSGHRIHHAFT